MFIPHFGKFIQITGPYNKTLIAGDALVLKAKLHYGGKNIDETSSPPFTRIVGKTEQTTAVVITTKADVDTFRKIVNEVFSEYPDLDWKHDEQGYRTFSATLIERLQPLINIRVDASIVSNQNLNKILGISSKK